MSISYFKGATRAYLVEKPTTDNKNPIPLLYLLINSISTHIKWCP